MGNTSSHHYHVKHAKAVNASKSHGGKLEKADLDDIYDFIRSLKHSEKGAELLDEFLERQTSKLEMFDGVMDEKKSFPISSITVVDVPKQSPPSPQQRKHRPAVPPSA
ncbi:expressed unknown protein [Seminavis robusta]|uniref:Uncharacterized protein n=1 Tax=Seminavis robusta TaxID=568900 RepID=A0A9N8EZ26_9STRA|nr:expressed unknown protein [Seminavis robusta]|eukprot:Sro1984_g309300.1 n/a (108) ;mRNA; r:2134-2457